MALVTPLLCLAVLEVFLRLSGYGYPTSFFLPQRINGRDVLTDNWQFGGRFFPRDLARTPQPVLFTPHKEPGTTRIFVIGESAAMGDPEPAFGLPRLLQAMLELKFPSNKFEVINVAMTAINSHVVREIAKDCAPLEGDVWVIYMGNNEVVGPFGSGTIFGRQTPPLPVIRAAIWLKQFRVVQLVTSLGQSGPAEWGGMEMFLKQQVSRDDPRMAMVRRYFLENLNEIIRLGHRTRTKVLVGTPVVNLRDCPPFASRHGTTLTAAEQAEFTQELARGAALADTGDYPNACTVLRHLWKKAGPDRAYVFADLYFQIGRCELALGSNGPARGHFTRALEYDTLRFRADGGIKSCTMERSATASLRTLVDTATLLETASSNNIPGAEFFYEHVHLTFDGNYQLARAFFDEIARALPQNVTTNAAAGTPTMEDCARRLAWTDWDRLQVYEEVRKRLQQPPFTGQSGHAARDAEWKRRIDELSAGLTPATLPRIADEYLAALRLAPDDWVLRENFAKFLEASGDTPGALAQWKEVMRLLPHDVQAHHHVGNLLDSLGRSKEALPFFRVALQHNPALLEARNGLALALANLGKLSDAERELNIALRLRPKSTEARVNLGQLLAQQGRTNEAVAQYELALRTDTNGAAAHVNLGKLLNRRGDTTGAVAHYEAALRINPKHAVAHFNLGNALLATDATAAAQHYAAAAQARPDFAEAHLALALELARTGNLTNAQNHFAEAARLQPNSPEARFNYGVLLAKLGKFADATKEFTETLRLQPGHPQAQEFLQRAERMQ